MNQHSGRRIVGQGDRKAGHLRVGQESYQLKGKHCLMRTGWRWTQLTILCQWEVPDLEQLHLPVRRRGPRLLLKGQRSCLLIQEWEEGHQKERIVLHRLFKKAPVPQEGSSSIFICCYLSNLLVKTGL